MLQAGLITTDDLRRAITLSFMLAFLAALPVMISIGWTVLAIALFAAGIAFFYTAGPYPLAYNRMGAIGVFLAMGVAMVCGTYYIHTRTVTGIALALSCSLGVYAAAILHANNTRDAEVDRAHGKIMLANKLGRTAAVREYALLVIAPLLITVALVLVQPEFWPLLAGLLVLPIAMRIIDLLRHCQTVAARHSAVPQSAQLDMTYAVLIGIGLVAMRISGQ